MATIPPPRASHEHVEPCRRHHRWMPHCPDCCAWHRDMLRIEREAAQKRVDKAAL